MVNSDTSLLTFQVNRVVSVRTVGYYRDMSLVAIDRVKYRDLLSINILPILYILLFILR